MSAAEQQARFSDAECAELLKRFARHQAADFEISMRVIEVHEIAERILAEAVHRWCHANNLTQYTVDQILRDTHVRAVAEWEKKTNKRFEVLP